MVSEWKKDMYIHCFMEICVRSVKTVSLKFFYVKTGYKTGYICKKRKYHNAVT